MKKHLKILVFTSDSFFLNFYQKIFEECVLCKFMYFNNEKELMSELTQNPSVILLDFSEKVKSDFLNHILNTKQNSLVILVVSKISPKIIFLSLFNSKVEYIIKDLDLADKLKKKLNPLL
jgi:DNA-binding NtrC family response regulator